jgi:Flp pilus assembly protein TadG
MNLKNQKGGALIELAVVLPLLLLLVAGFVDFGFLFYNKQVLTNASREGARAGIVNVKASNGSKIVVSEQAIQDLVEEYCDKLWNDESAVLATSAPGVASLNYPSDLTVTVTLSGYDLLLAPLLNLFGGSFGTLDISAVTVMRME